MTPVTYTAQEAARKILAAYDAGTLSAQAPEPRACYHVIQDDWPYTCAIGALYPLADALALNKGMGDAGYMFAGGMMKAGLLIITDDAVSVSDLQGMHDRWANHGSHHEPAFIDRVRELAQ